MATISPIAAHPPGASRLLPNYVGGQKFASIKALTTALAKGAAILAPGDSVKIAVGAAFPGGNAPFIGGLNKSTAFTAKLSGGDLVITAKSNAKIGKSDKVYFAQPGLPGMPTQKTPLKLEVGIGRIMFG